jgi:hypothetical protein
MARKETIYTVDKNTNTIIRVSKTYLSALQYVDTLTSPETVYLCTSLFQSMKKGDVMVDVVSTLESKGD